MEPADQSLEKARTLAADRRYGEAAIAFLEAAEHALDAGQVEPAWRAFDAAAESWRRADSPEAAVRALHRALSLVEGEHPPAVLGRAKLAAVKGELGQAPDGYADLAALGEAALAGPAGAIALDVRVALAFSLGRFAEAAADVDRLSRHEGPAAAITTAFRRSELAVVVGDFDRAEDFLLEVVALASRLPDPTPAVSAVAGAKAEIARWRGEVSDAVRHSEEAMQGQRDAGRRTQAWRAEIERLRAMADAGIAAVPLGLDEAIRDAEARGLRPLEASLRTARAVATAEVDPAASRRDFEVAIALASQCGLRLAAAWARMERASRLSGPLVDRISDVLEAEQILVDHQPLRTRAMLVRARLLRDADPLQSRALASAARTAFLTMGMCRDAEVASALS